MRHARVDEAAAAASPKRRRLWWIVAAAAGIVLVVAGVAAFLLWPSGGTPVTEAQALEAFKTEVGRSEEPAAGDGLTSVEGVAVDTTAPPVDATAAGGAGEVAPTGDSPAGADSPAGGVQLPGRPAQGVYSFAASGGETVSLGPASQNRTLADTVTAIVRHSGSCWTFTHNLFLEHVETTTYCPGGDGSLRMNAHTKTQKIGPLSAEANMSCSPQGMLGPAAAPTGRWTTTCTLQTHTPVFTANVTQTGTTTVTGPENVAVGGTGVPAWHVRERRDARGDFNGRWNDDIWFSTTDHTILRITRDTDMAGPARFTEATTFTLRSLQPRA